MGGLELPLLFGLLSATIILLAYRLSRQQGGGSETGFVVLVAIGALIAPQVATVILLAVIYQQLVLIYRKS